MDQGHSFIRGPNKRPRQCVDKVSKVWTKAIRLQEVQIKDQDSVLTRCQKYGPKPFVYKMSSRHQNKNQDSVLTRYQKYGPRPFIYKMSSRRQNKRSRECVDKVSKVWTKAIHLQDVFKTSK